MGKDSTTTEYGKSKKLQGKKENLIMMNITAITRIFATLGQDELKELVGAFQEMIDTPETVQKHWEPTEGEQYFYLWGTGKKDGGVFTTENQKDVMRLAVGNCFKTEEERDAAAEYLMIVAELKRFAIDHNDEIDWDDHSQRKYKLCWNRETEKVDSTWSRRKITDGIYFSSHEVAMAAVDAVGEDRIKKFYLPDAE